MRKIFILLCFQQQEEMIRCAPRPAKQRTEKGSLAAGQSRTCFRMSSGQFNLRLICQTELGAETEIMRLSAAVVDVVAGDGQDVRSVRPS